MFTECRSYKLASFAVLPELPLCCCWGKLWWPTLNAERGTALMAGISAVVVQLGLCVNCNDTRRMCFVSMDFTEQSTPCCAQLAQRAAKNRMHWLHPICNSIIWSVGLQNLATNANCCLQLQRWLCHDQHQKIQSDRCSDCKTVLASDVSVHGTNGVLRCIKSLILCGPDQPAALLLLLLRCIHILKSLQLKLLVIVTSLVR